MTEGVVEQPWHKEVHAMRGEEDNGRGVQRDDILREEDTTLGGERERKEIYLIG